MIRFVNETAQWTAGAKKEMMEGSQDRCSARYFASPLVSEVSGKESWKVVGIQYGFISEEEASKCAKYANQGFSDGYEAALKDLRKFMGVER